MIGFLLFRRTPPLITLTDHSNARRSNGLARTQSHTDTDTAQGTGHARLPTAGRACIENVFTNVLLLSEKEISRFCLNFRCSVSPEVDYEIPRFACSERLEGKDKLVTASCLYSRLVRYSG